MVKNQRNFGNYVNIYHESEEKRAENVERTCGSKAMNNSLNKTGTNLGRSPIVQLQCKSSSFRLDIIGRTSNLKPAIAQPNFIRHHCATGRDVPKCAEKFVLVISIDFWACVSF